MIRENAYKFGQIYIAPQSVMQPATIFKFPAPDLDALIKTLESRKRSSFLIKFALINDKILNTTCYYLHV